VTAKLKSLKSKTQKRHQSLPKLLEVAQLACAGLPLTSEQAAVYLQLAPGTLNIYRMRGTGPRCSYAASRPRYAKSDLDEWIAAGKPKATAVVS
jgi:hypothetical protein